MKRILLAIDMQKRFNTNNCTQTAVDNLKDLLSCKKDGFDVRVFTNNPDAEIVDELKPFADKVLERHTYSAVTPDFELLCDGTDRVYIAGFDTDSCVLATAFALFDKGIQPVIIQNCCAISDSINTNTTTHKHTLDIVKRQFGRQSVITSGEMKQIISAK